MKKFVQKIENSVISLLDDYHIKSEAQTDAHGVYVGDAKVASIGLRISGGCSYHGLALNVDMDLTPFSYINPCGFEGLKVTQLKDHGVKSSCEQIQEELTYHLCRELNYNAMEVAAFG